MQKTTIYEVRAITPDPNNMPVFFDRYVIGSIQAQWLVYEHVYYNNFSGDGTPCNDAVKDHVIARRDRYLGIIDWLDQYKNVRILDVGCGRGEFLEGLKNHGYTDIKGIDIHHKSLDLASRYAPVCRLDMHFCNKLDPHDIVWAAHILQHSYDPVKLMERLWVITGKVLYIELPVQTFGMAIRPFEGHTFFCENEDCLIGYVYNTLPYITEIANTTDGNGDILYVGMVLRK